MNHFRLGGNEDGGEWRMRKEGGNSGFRIFRRNSRRVWYLEEEGIWEEKVVGKEIFLF